jgi:hypothetical protein
MVRYVVVVLSTLMPFMSCSEMPMAGPDATCNCPTPTAAQVSYSNTTSHLASTNVQAAVDELAARPNEGPLAMRVQVVSVNANITPASNFASASCPDETHDLAIGGACAPLSATTNGILSTGLDNRTPMDSGGPAARYGCTFNVTAASASVAVQVSCLKNVR